MEPILTEDLVKSRNHLDFSLNEDQEIASVITLHYDLFEKAFNPICIFSATTGFQH